MCVARHRMGDSKISQNGMVGGRVFFCFFSLGGRMEGWGKWGRGGVRGVGEGGGLRVEGGGMGSGEREPWNGGFITVTIWVGWVGWLEGGSVPWTAVNSKAIVSVGCISGSPVVRFFECHGSAGWSCAATLRRALLQVQMADCSSSAGEGGLICKRLLGLAGPGPLLGLAGACCCCCQCRGSVAAAADARHRQGDAIRFKAEL